MQRLGLLATCLAASIALAQTPSPAGRQSEPLAGAKTASYYERYADEMRAKQAMEKARTVLKTRKFREALAQSEVNGGITATAGCFVSAKGVPFVALQVGLPPGTAKTGSALTLFGEVVDATGRVLADFELPSTVLESKGDQFLEYSLLPGDIAQLARVGVAKGDAILGVAKTLLRAGEASGSRGIEISQLIVSNNVFNLSRAQNPFEPFAFGGTKVIPKPDRAFRSNDETWLFVELRDSDAAQTPALNIRTTVEGMGRKIAGLWQPAEVFPLKGVNGHFGIGTTVDLSSLAPGEYRITLALRNADAQIVERPQTITIRQ
jgi:hypothetical protein